MRLRGPCTLDEAMARAQVHLDDQLRRLESDLLARDALDPDDLDDLLAEQAAEQQAWLQDVRRELIAWLAAARD
jgi:hypothetical protein